MAKIKANLVDVIQRKIYAAEVNFENGITVEGILTNTLYKENKLILLSFENCKVTDTDGKCYFEPAWGTFDMAIGNTIVSVFNGTADKNIFEDQLYVSPQRTFQQNYSSKDLVYQNIFQEIRNYREQKKSDDSLLDIWENIKNNFKEDWLAALEILELADTDTSKEILSTEIRAYLKVQIDTYPKFTKLIKDGLSIIDAKLKFE
jgi:phenylalanine-4-hydroxylase